ncbi:MAG: hypothetical protein KI790_08610 [Cyclobacteriaceae bacterium]|nr:hypothetical protein [Cyclobacteriaceae bacterium HetDA_MAG_MS6]
MNAASLADIKKELKSLSQDELQQLCLRLARHKVENKELLTYLLYYPDEDMYIESIKGWMEESFEEVNVNSLHWAKKTIRKISRLTNKYIRYAGSKRVEVELLIHFCRCTLDLGLPLKKSTSLINLFERQIIKAKKAMSKLHEDLRYDYEVELTELMD